MTPEQDKMFAPLTSGELASHDIGKARQQCATDWRPILPAPVAPPDRPAHSRHGRASRTWTYHDATGAVLFLACRFDKPNGEKKVLPLTYGVLNGTEGWHWQAPPTPRPLYGLDRLATRPDAVVIVCEGEKAADAAERLFPDHVAVTSQGGAKAAGKSDWTPLAGRCVTIWPDHDPEGAGYAGDVARLALKAGAANVRIVRVPDDFPPKWDPADALPEGWTPGRSRELLDAAKPALIDRARTETQHDPDPEVVIDELATLPIIEYERRRKDAAKALGMRTSVLDAIVAKLRPSRPEATGQGRRLELPTPEPWPKPVDGAALIEEIAAAVRRYVALLACADTAIALWIVHTHAFDASVITPRLAITSPEKQCGKSTLLRLLGKITAKPLAADNIRPAAVFRTVELERPTLLIDEADSFLSDDDELRGIINSGHHRGGQVIRTVGDDHEPRMFSAWAPTAIACIGRLPSTIEDRSISITMRRRRPDEQVARFRTDQCDDLALLARKAARWAVDKLDSLKDADPKVPAELNDRAADNWRPLLAIADLAGRKWPERAREAARALSPNGNSDDQSARTQLLADIRATFEESGADRLASEAIVRRLAEMEHRPWPEWKNGKAITVRQLAKLLAPFGIIPGTVRFDDGKTAKGYYLDNFTDAFARYLTCEPSHRHNAQKSAVFEQFRTVTPYPDVTDQNASNAPKIRHCDGVTDETPDPSQEYAEWTG